MAKLILTQRALASESDLGAERVQLSDKATLIQSMRAVASTVSRLLAEWHFWLAAEKAYSELDDSGDYIQIVKSWTMKEAMLDLILIRLRCLFEPHTKSLSTNQIAKLLREKHLHEFLRDRSQRQLGESNFDENEFNFHVRRILMLCRIHHMPANDISHPSFKRRRMQARLADRAADARVAHNTLDPFEVHVEDLYDLIQHALIIAKSIRAILGDDATRCDYGEVDRAALEASRELFAVDHGAGLLTELGQEPPDQG